MRRSSARINGCHNNETEVEHFPRKNHDGTKHLIRLSLLTLLAVAIFCWEKRDRKLVATRSEFQLASKPPQAFSSRLSSSSSPIRPLSPLAQLQAANYRNGTGLMINVHITHHGGTTFCQAVGKVGRTPSRACWIVQPGDHVAKDYPHHNPWQTHETSQNVAVARRFFHMISWEYEEPPPVSLAETAWEDPNLFSVLILRDPMKRLLAGDGHVAREYPGVSKGTANRTVLDAYVASNRTDNFALRILAGKGCCQGKDTDRKHLEAAKALVQRFSVVIDIECLNESLKLLARNEWNMTLGKIGMGRRRASPRERIGNVDVYNQLREKNRLDIELYEWSKTLSYFDCSLVSSSGKLLSRLE
jgi:hypothetical protein